MNMDFTKDEFQRQYSNLCTSQDRILRETANNYILKFH